MSELSNTFICGRRCDNVTVPCIASREPNCDGQTGQIFYDIIPAGEGWCLDGRCYNISAISRLDRDPYTRRLFGFANADEGQNQGQRRQRSTTLEDFLDDNEDFLDDNEAAQAIDEFLEGLS